MIWKFFQWSLAALERVSLSWAAALAEYLFRSVPRRPESEAEGEALRAACALSLDLDGKRLAAWRWGDAGPVALVVHGWGGSAAQLLPVVEALRAAGYAVVAFDAPAHGHSAGRQSSLPQFAAAIAAVASRVGPVEALVTHSMGGAAASLAIAGGLSVQRAVFLAPPADAKEWLVKFAKRMGLSPRLAVAARRRMEGRLRIRFDRLNARTLGPSVGVPLLVIHDRSDAEVIWYDGAAMAANVRNGRLLTTEGLGHRRILRDPEVLRAAVEFLARPLEPSDFGSAPEGDRCRYCGETLRAAENAAAECCESCAVERELFDKDLRWSHQAAVTVLQESAGS